MGQHFVLAADKDTNAVVWMSRCDLDQHFGRRHPHHRYATVDSDRQDVIWRKATGVPVARTQPVHRFSQRRIRLRPLVSVRIVPHDRTGRSHPSSSGPQTHPHCRVLAALCVRRGTPKRLQRRLPSTRLAVNRSVNCTVARNQ